MTTELFNFTPHAIVIFHSDGSQQIIGGAADDNGDRINVRLDTRQTEVGLHFTKNHPLPIPIYTPQVATGILGLPECSADEQRLKPIVVSAMVGEYLAANPAKWAGAVYSPDTSPASVVRDGAGQIVGVKRLMIYKGGDGEC